MRSYAISVSRSRFDTVWQQRNLSWEELLNKIRTPERGSETHQEYFKMAKSKQDELKDVGGFVGGTLKDGKRSAQTVTGRDLITLDLDAIPANETQMIIDKVKSLGYSCIIYSTRKHTERKPRLRVLIPMDRTITADEYEPVARMVAQLIGISYCDPTTFQPSRLMYWPSVSADAEYVFEHQEMAECNPDCVLWMYSDWTDVGTWPIVPGEQNRIATLHKHQEDPTAKKGIIGMFCRTYDIYGAMLQFLPGIYEETDKEDRWTYVGGSTSGGAIIYGDGMFLYSHHATDPCSGQLVNAFDMVRLHKFSHLDDDAKAGTRSTSLPSYKAMCELCESDDKVKRLLAQEQALAIAEAFAAPEAVSDEYDPEWMVKLERVKDSKDCKNTIENVGLIIKNDINLRGRIWFDEFSGMIMVKTPVPWSDEKGVIRQWTDTDDIGLFWFLEKGYIHKITQQKSIGATNLVASQNKVNPVKDYLDRVSRNWDGQKRLDTIFSRYLGAEDNAYTRAVARKFLVAAVARVYEERVKFDNMVVLVGRQGLGKSTLFRKLGMDWFNDSVTSFDGKEAAELIQGSWIVEIGELTAMTKSETSLVKQFMSKQDDKYRPAYGRRTEVHPRKCIFVGTSNNYEFLKDTTGNRRFWPVDVGITEYDETVFKNLTQDIVDQIWAEAVMWFNMGEPLYIEGDVLKKSEAVQREHMILSGKEGIVEEFLNTDIPKDWYTLQDMQRKEFMNGNLHTDVELERRTKVCPIEVWVYCYNKSPGSMTRSDSAEIGNILRVLGWEPTSGSYRFGNLGHTRGFVRKC